MEPKEMTNAELLVEFANRTKGYGFLNDPKPVVVELLRRMDAADVLRKDCSDMYAILGKAAPGFAVQHDGSVAESLIIEDVASVREILKRVSARLDAVKAKESEASHVV